MEDLVTTIQSSIRNHFKTDRNIDSTTIETLVREVESTEPWRRLFAPISPEPQFYGYNERHQTPFGHAIIGMVDSSFGSGGDERTPEGQSTPSTNYLFDLSCAAAEYGVVHYAVPFILISLMEGHAGTRVEKIMSKTMNDHKWTVPLFAAITAADSAQKLLVEMEQSPRKRAPTIDWEIFATCTQSRQEGERIVDELRHSGYCVMDRFLRDRQTIGRITRDENAKGDTIVRGITERGLEAIEERAKEATATLGEFSQTDQVRRFRFGGGSKAMIALSGIVQAFKVQLCYRISMALLKLSREKPTQQERAPFDGLPVRLLAPDAVVVTSFLEDSAPPSSVVSWPVQIDSGTSSLVAVYFMGGSVQDHPDGGGIRLHFTGGKWGEVRINAVRDRLLLFLANKEVSFESIHGNSERFELVTVFADSASCTDKAFYLDTTALMPLSESDMLESVQEQLADPKCCVCQKMATQACSVCRRALYCGDACAQGDASAHHEFCVPLEKQPHNKLHEEVHRRLEGIFRTRNPQM